MKRTLTLVLAAVIALSVSACGGGDPSSTAHVVNEKAWNADLAVYGERVTDWPAYRASWEETCAEKDFGLFVGVELDHGYSRSRVRVDFANACPDRLADLDAVFKSLDETGAVCDMPASARTEEQSFVAEALGC